MVWTLYADKIADEAIKEEKTVVFGAADAEYYYMYMQPANTSKGYQLYRSSVSDGKNWTSQSLTGLPAGEVRLSQITEMGDYLYAVTTKGALYRSANGLDWTLVENTPSIKSLLGSIRATDDFTGSGKQTSALATVIDTDGKLTFASLDKSQEWKSGVEVPAGFPISNFGNVSYTSMFRARLMLVAGRDKNNNLLNSSWATADGIDWAMLTDSEANQFDKQEGVSVVEYDEKFFMLSGINGAGKASSAVYLSKDGGVNWTVSDTLVVMPADFKPRGFASICVDQHNFMYLFGGKETTNSNVSDQIWRGRINRLGFKK